MVKYIIFFNLLHYKTINYKIYFPLFLILLNKKYTQNIKPKLKEINKNNDFKTKNKKDKI